VRRRKTEEDDTSNKDQEGAASGNTPTAGGTTTTGQTRAVQIHAALAADLAEWRLYCGRPPEDALVFPTRNGEHWTDWQWRNWRKRVFAPAAAEAELSTFRPYDLRHSFVSLLIAEGRSVWRSRNRPATRPPWR